MWHTYCVWIIDDTMMGGSFTVHIDATTRPPLCVVVQLLGCKSLHMSNGFPEMKSDTGINGQWLRDMKLLVSYELWVKMGTFLSAKRIINSLLAYGTKVHHGKCCFLRHIFSILICEYNGVILLLSWL